MANPHSEMSIQIERSIYPMNHTRRISMIFYLVAVGGASVMCANPSQASAQMSQDDKSTTDLPQELLPTSNSVVLQETQKLLPKFQKSETKHYIILSDSLPQDITMVGSLLETTFLKYHEVCDSLGWKPKPLRHKLVAVMFRDQRNYNDFATQVDKVTKAWAMGYYNPLADRLVFYKSESRADVKKVMAELHDQERQLQEAQAAQQSGGRALRPNPDLAHVQDQVAAEKDRIHDATAGTFVSTAVHEAAHQLFFHTDIQRARASYPLWLAEGLATNFETERINLVFGYQVDNWQRRDAFKQALDKDRIIPLEVLLTQDRFTDGKESAEAVGYFYAQAYALTNWMLRERPTELRLYLEALLDGSFADAKSRKAEFELIFGPIPRIERNWVRYEGRREKDFLLSPYGKRVLAKLLNHPVATNVATAPSSKSEESLPSKNPDSR